MNALDKLRVLLPHWQEHNKEHAGEFQTWAERARELGEAELADYIEAAARRMEEANHDLAHAIELAGGEAGAHDHGVDVHQHRADVHHHGADPHHHHHHHHDHSH